jgi:hypothetical protein
MKFGKVQPIKVETGGILKSLSFLLNLVGLRNDKNQF